MDLIYGCTHIKVVRNEDLYQQIGRDIYFGLVDHLKVPSFRVHNYTSFYDFWKTVPQEFGQPQHFWVWSKRANGTYRPHRCLTNDEKLPSLPRVQSDRTSQNSYVMLFLEFSARVALENEVFHPHKTEADHILLFFKFYDPKKEDVRYVGKLSVKGSDMAGDICGELAERANLDTHVELNLYKETRFACSPVDRSATFIANKLENGDIIWFQKSPPAQKHCSYPDVPCFLNFIHNSQSQVIQSAKTKVITKKDELRKTQEKVTWVIEELEEAQATVMRVKDELKESEEDVVALEAKLYP